jgi:PAS domain S-box-containing protein
VSKKSNSNVRATADDPADEGAYKLLFDSAPDAILVVDAGGVIRRNNTEAERLLDAASCELIGLSVERLVPLASRKKHVGMRESFAHDPHKRPMGMGLALNALKLSGHEFPVEISLAPTRAGNLSESGGEVIVILRDVSERMHARRTERELHRAQALTRVSDVVLRERELARALQSVTETICEPLAADFLALFLLKHEIDRFVCKAASGRDAASVWQAGFALNDAPWLGQALAAAAPTLVGDARAMDTELPIALRDTGARSLILAPLNSHERGNGLLIAAHREAHRFSIDDVAFLEATANIVSNAVRRHDTEEKLLLSQRLESLGQLTGGVAHDFNNLLTVMSGNLQILAEMQFDDEYAHRAIAAALRSTQRGTELTSKLLAFSRRQTLRPQPLDVSESIHAFRDLLSRTLGENIEVKVHVANDLPMLVADRGQLETALLNLAVNARDAMPEGGKLVIDASETRIVEPVTVGAEAELPPGRYVRISVSDTGEGMSRETMARAFEPFFTTKPAGKGSGLGLSMVYGFAKQSSGHVTAYSEPSVGTTINLYLPASEEAKRAPVVKGKSIPRAASLARGTETILVVEDDEAVRDVAIRFLEGLGYRTLAAEDRMTALAALESDDDVKLVFTDVVLQSGETGPKVVEALRQQKPELLVLFTSGYARSALPLQLPVESDFNFLRKPYSREDLARSVRATLDAGARAPSPSTLRRKRNVESDD